MIKFFRNIRKRMLTENKFSKYLIYAIGEIILVVIGILIALGVNNWNQNKNDNQLGNELLKRVHADLVQDTVYFRTTIRQNKQLREDIKLLLADLYEGVDNIQQVQAMSSTFDQALDQVFTTNDNTYVNMVNSGTLGLINNTQIKTEIVALYGEYEEIGTLLGSINQWMLAITSKLDTETDFMRFNSQVSDIFTTSEMLNDQDFAFLNDSEDERFKILIRAISATAFNQKVRSAYYEQLIMKCKTVLALIQTEIND